MIDPVTVEVIAESNAESPAGSGKKPLNLGNLGRSSIADLTVTGVTADPTTRTVSVSSSAVLQPVAAEVLEGFVQVYQGYFEAVLQLKFGKTPEEAKAIATAKVEKDHIKAGDALGHIAATNLFFQVILVGHNRILSEIIVSLMSRINFLRARSMLRKNRGRECATELKAIADALKKRDRAAAKAATAHHISQCCNAARDVYEEFMVA